MNALGWAAFFAVTFLFAFLLAVLLKITVLRYVPALMAIPLWMWIVFIILAAFALQGMGFDVASLYAAFFDWLSKQLSGQTIISSPRAAGSYTAVTKEFSQLATTAFIPLAISDRVHGKNKKKIIGTVITLTGLILFLGGFYLMPVGTDIYLYFWVQVVFNGNWLYGSIVANIVSFAMIVLGFMLLRSENRDVNFIGKKRGKKK